MAPSAFQRPTSGGLFTAGFIAQLLNYYPQLTLASLRAMPTEEFLFLLMGMLDNISPDVTEPTQEKIARMTKAAHERARSRRRM